MTLTTTTAVDTCQPEPGRLYVAGYALSVLATIVFCMPASAGEKTGGGDDLLAEMRWREHQYGISLRTPLGSRLYERIIDDVVPWALGRSAVPKLVRRDLRARLPLKAIRKMLGSDPQAEPLPDVTKRQQVVIAQQAAHFVGHGADSAVLRIEGDIDYFIRLYFMHSKRPMHVHNAATQAMHVDARLIGDFEKIKVDGRAGALVFYRLLEHDGFRAYGKAYLTINERTFAVLQLDTPSVLLEQMRPVFAAVLDSLRIADPQVLAADRKEDVERGIAWRQSLDAEELRRARRDVQLLRITQGKDDIGFMRIEMAESNDLGIPALAVVVTVRVIEGDTAFDTRSIFTLSDDLTHEIWSIKTTARARRPVAKQNRYKADLLTWIETGLRFKDDLEVKREGPTHLPRKQAWQRPPHGYVSQVMLHLTDVLLPPDKKQTMGFYAYMPALNKIVYRTVSVEPLEGGARRVWTRPSPGHGQSIAEYDADGRLRWRLLPGGRIIQPTTQAEFRRIWNVPAKR